MSYINTTWFENKVRMAPIYVKTGMARINYLRNIEGVVVSEAEKKFLLSPGRKILRHNAYGHEYIVKRACYRINELDRKVLTYNFLKYGYSNEQVKTIVEYIISSTNLHGRSLDPRDYTIDNNLNVKVHSIAEQLKIIEEDKKLEQEIIL